MKTKINNILRGSGLLAALFLMGTSSVYAATTAGTDITNTATVTFRTAVGGTVDQSGTGDTETFETDRLVTLTVTGGADVDTAPGQVGPSLTLVRTYEVTNNTNGTIDILLSNFDQSGDTFDETGVDRLYEAGAGGTYAGTETNGDTIDNVAAGATYTVHVITTSTISTSQVNGDTDGIYLKAQAADPTTSVAITADTASDTSTTVDNVVNDGDGDGAGTDDASRDGAHSALRRYIIRTATVSLVKTSTAIYDPVNCSVADGAQNLTVTCSNDAFRIPGARIVYKLAVINQNTAQNVDATRINISDTLDANTTYVAGSLYRIATTEAGYAATTCYSGGGSLTDAVDSPDAGTGGSVNQLGSAAGSTVTFAELAGLTEASAVVYCYKVTVN